MKSTLSRAEIKNLLATESPEKLTALFSCAKNIREQYFGNKIFTYGFVYFSTWCRNDCAFCYYRKSNNIDRYRKNPAEIIKLATNLAASGVNLIDLTMGEDELYHENDFAHFFDIVREIKAKTQLTIMISPGVVAPSVIDAAANAGIDWFALYQETHNQELFQRLRLGQCYHHRMSLKKHAANRKMLTEEGVLTGVGETLDDIAESIIQMGEIGASQMRAMSFVPQTGTPMAVQASPQIMLELKIIAAIRICYPGVLIPASLDVDGISGLERRLEAGANVVTSIIQPETGLMGVAQNSKDIEDGGRTMEQIVPILNRLGLHPATTDDYKACIKSLRDKL